MSIYLSYVGIRVRDLERSLRFYQDLFGLREVARGDNSKQGGGTYVLLRDSRSVQKLELNWYPGGSPYAVTYDPGEGLDHVAFRVEALEGFLRELAARGIERVPIDPALAEPAGARGTSSWFHVEYVKDPDGNWVELFERSDPIGSTPPNAY